MHRTPLLAAFLRLFCRFTNKCQGESTVDRIFSKMSPFMGVACAAGPGTM